MTKKSRTPDDIPKDCKASFLFNRRENSFYNVQTNRKVKKKRPCNDPFTLAVKRTISIPIYWANLARAATDWDDATVTQRLEEAVDFFKRYCIQLQLEPVRVADDEASVFDGKLKKATDADKAETLILNTCKSLRMRKGRPSDFIFLLFVGDFQEIKYETRAADISGVFSKFKCAVIQSVPDKGSQNIVTHELIHALGQVPGMDKDEPLGWRIPGGDDRQNTWDHGLCPIEDMGNTPRTDPKKSQDLLPTRMLDYAAYVQFLRFSKTISEF